MSDPKTTAAIRKRLESWLAECRDRRLYFLTDHDVFEIVGSLRRDLSALEETSDIANA